MTIQWFPGHMHATKKALLERVKTIDVVVEMVDARLPGSSANPMLKQLMDGLPSLKVLNKQDLADPVRTQQWLDHFNAQPGTQAVALDLAQHNPWRLIRQACEGLAPQRGTMLKPLRVLIGGVPNVGKSTLINSLMGKKSAKTGDEAGVTKQEQRYLVSDTFYVYDTPGVLWPRIVVPESGYLLAASGAVGRNAYDEEVVALHFLDHLRRDYPESLIQRYKLKVSAQAVSEQASDHWLNEIGRKRGGLMAGGRIHLQKAAEVLLTDFRSGTLGRMTLETPALFEAWLAAGTAEDARRQAEKQAKQAARSGRRQAPPDKP